MSSFYIRTLDGRHFDFKGCSCGRFTGEVYLDILECRRVGLVGVVRFPGILGVEHRRRAKIKLQQLDIILLLVFGAGGCTHLLQGPGLLLIVAEGCSGQHFFHAAEGAALFVGLGFIIHRVKARLDHVAICICSHTIISGVGFYIHSDRLVGACKATHLIRLSGIDFCAILFVGAFQLVGKIDISGVLNKSIACTGIEGDGLPLADHAPAASPSAASSQQRQRQCCSQNTAQTI